MSTAEPRRERPRQVSVIGAGGCAPGSEPWRLAEEVASATGDARNLTVVASGDVVIAIGGEWGTLSEIAHARKLGRTVVALRSWGLTGREAMDGAPGVIPVEDPGEAVRIALEEAAP